MAGSSETWLGWLLALGSTVGFSLAPFVAKTALLSGVPPAELMAVRMALTLLLMGGFMLLFAPARLRIDRRGFFIAVGTGMINGLGFLGFFLALLRLEASIASMIYTLSPLVVILLLALKGEPISRRHGVRLLLGISGVFLLIGPAGDVDIIGAMLVMVTVVVFAVQLVSIQWFLQAYHAWTITFYIILGINLVGAGWWLVEGFRWQDPGRIGWNAIIVLALISTFLARLAMFGAIRKLGSGQVGLTVPLENLLSVIWSLLFLQERLTWTEWLGGSLILASMILATQRLRLNRRQLRWRFWSRP